MTPSVVLRHPRLLMLGAAHCLLMGFLTHLLLQTPRLPLLPKGNVATVPEMKLPAATGDATNVEDLYAALTSQPALHTSRQLVPERPAPTVPESTPPAYILTGYLGLPGRAAHAFLQPSAGGHTVVVGLGDIVDGWSVVGVSARQVELKQGNRSVSIGKDGSSQNQTAALSAPAAATAPVVANASNGGSLPSTPTQLGTVSRGNALGTVPGVPSKPPPKPVAVIPKNPPHLFIVPHPAPKPHP